MLDDDDDDDDDVGISANTTRDIGTTRNMQDGLAARRCCVAILTTTSTIGRSSAVTRGLVSQAAGRSGNKPAM